MPTNNQKEKLLDLMRELLLRDDALRQQFQMGEKFRFIRDRLAALAKTVEESVRTISVADQTQGAVLAEDEVLVYIHLYNAQGLIFQTWQKMLNPAVFYEYSVNRPAYANKAHIDQFIRSKSNKAQHGYLTIAVKKTAVISMDLVKDALDQPLIKVKEGALRFDRLLSFTHNENDYQVSSEGEIKLMSS